MTTIDVYLVETTIQAEVVGNAIEANLGTQGPQGPEGAPAFVHTQSTPSDTWTINHNLGHRPSVTVLSPGGLEVDASVIHTSVNQTIVSFVTAQSGSARLI